MLKNLLSSVLLLSYASAINFEDFQGVVGNIDSKIIDKTFKSDLSSIKDSIKNKAMDSVTSIINNKTGGLLNNAAGGVLSHCYDYKPVPIKPFDFSFDPCTLFSNPKISPCDTAPNLEDMGYYKKSNKLQIELDLKRYCNKASIKETIDKVVESINTNITVDKAISNKEQKQKTLANSAIGLLKGSKNVDVKKAIETNNYKNYKVMKDVLTRADDNKNEIDFSSINVEYKTIDDYEKSVQNLASDYLHSKSSINLNKLKRESYEQFKRINNDTTNDLERETQKQALKSKILEDYKSLLEKYEKYEIDKKIWLLTKENKQVVYPTATVVKTAATVEERINMIYYIEKQKKDKASIIADVKSKAFDMYEKAIKVIEVSYLKSIEFDREKEYKIIMTKLNSIGSN